MFELSLRLEIRPRFFWPRTSHHISSTSASGHLRQSRLLLAKFHRGVLYLGNLTTREDPCFFIRERTESNMRSGCPPVEIVE